MVGPAKPGEAIVRMLGSGVYGSDIHAARGGFSLWKLAVILGREGIDIIDELGEGLAAAVVDQLVAVSHTRL